MVFILLTPYYCFSNYFQDLPTPHPIFETGITLSNFQHYTINAPILELCEYVYSTIKHDS